MFGVDKALKFKSLCEYNYPTKYEKKLSSKNNQQIFLVVNF